MFCKDDLRSHRIRAELETIGAYLGEHTTRLAK